MKTWRVLGLVWAVLSLGQLMACGGGGDGAKPDGAKARADGGTDVDEDDGGDDPEVDSGPATGDLDASVDANSGCVPKTCSDFGYECGPVDDDGCGGALDCGKCKGTDTCGGAGEAHFCGCTPKSCEQLSSEHGVKVCGTLTNGCGRDLKCGGDEVCGANSMCGGGGADNECGCTPDPNPCAGKECGSATDGCGHTVQCGASAGACSDNRECNAQQACTCKVDTTAYCSGKCGPHQTADGCSIQCTPCLIECASGGGCGASAACSCPLATAEVCRADVCCVPEARAVTCAVGQCGTKQNNCGQAVDCGGCASGQQCSANQCKDPVAELIGTYAVRSVGFGDVSILTRAEGLLLVDIFKDSSGKLMMKEQSCWSAGYSRANSTTENVITTMTAADSDDLVPTTIELDLSNSKDLLGVHEWVRPVQPSNQNTSGWRRGRPSYCPADGGPADSSVPLDARAIGPKKPWLGGGTCLCPKDEVLKRKKVCVGKTGADLLTCVETWAQTELPYQPGMESSNSDVTDCRVVDDDLDGKPALSASITVPLLGDATLRSASVTANVFWGKIDLSGAKAHWGASQDQPALKSSTVACEDVKNAPLGSGLLCGTSSGKLCGAYNSTKPLDKEHRVNPVDFVSLQGRTPAGGGSWTCQALVDNRTALFGPAPVWAATYAAASANNNCKAPTP